jgi:glutamine amidotransferase
MKCERIKVQAMVSARPEDILQASKLVLPGVGSFAAGMRNLREAGLVEPLEEMVLVKKTPMLGICLGMQLFTQYSEEGDCPGLGWINARTRRLTPPAGSVGFRVPHIGWNLVDRRRPSRLFEGIEPQLRYYFVHSYAVFCDDPDLSVGETTYGQTFSSVIESGNLYGAQFHPEKSHHHGLAMMENFLRRA